MAGCTAFFIDVEKVAFDLVKVKDLIRPVTFDGIANVMVFVTSPFEFFVMPGREVGKGIGILLAEAD